MYLYNGRAEFYCMSFLAYGASLISMDCSHISDPILWSLYMHKVIRYLRKNLKVFKPCKLTKYVGQVEFTHYSIFTYYTHQTSFGQLVYA